MPAIRRVTFEELGRAVLFKEIRLIVHNRCGHWAGPQAEKEADSFLRQAALKPPILNWNWSLSVEIVLETDEPLSVWTIVDSTRPETALRTLCANWFQKNASDLQSPPPHRVEAHRVAQLLLGRKLEAPRGAPSNRELLARYQNLLRSSSEEFNRKNK